MQADVWSTSPLPLTPPVSVAAVPMSFSALSSRCLICVDPFSIGSPVPSQAQTGRTTNVVMTLDSANTTPNMSSLVPLDWHGHGSFNVRVNVPQGRAERRPCAPAPAKPPPEIAGSEPPVAPPAWEPNKGAEKKDIFDSKRLSTKLQSEEIKKTFANHFFDVLSRP